MPPRAISPKTSWRPTARLAGAADWVGGGSAAASSSRKRTGERKADPTSQTDEPSAVTAEEGPGPYAAAGAASTDASANSVRGGEVRSRSDMASSTGEGGTINSGRRRFSPRRLVPGLCLGGREPGRGCHHQLRRTAVFAAELCRKVQPSSW